MAEASVEWAARPRAARTLRVAALLAPLIGGAVAAVATSWVLPIGSSTLTTVLRTLAVIAVSTCAVRGVDRVARKALPLAAMMNLSLVFPDQAPSRFKSALRSGSSRRLEKLVADTVRSGLPEDPNEAAHRVVDLISAIGDHDRRTRGHSERVRLYADLLGEELHLTREERQKLQWGALLHDLGKLRVPPEILNKNGKPTDEEWAILKQHPAFGEEMIEPLRPFLGEWAAAVGGHHERWDGTGYPRGLRGSEIPRAAAIVAVADSFEVMTATRAYKKPMPIEEARKELTRCAGQQFDPTVVRAFLSISVGKVRGAFGPLAALAHLPVVSSAAQVPAAIGTAVPTVLASSVAVAGLTLAPVSTATVDAQQSASPVATTTAVLTATPSASTTWRRSTPLRSIEQRTAVPTTTTLVAVIPVIPPPAEVEAAAPSVPAATPPPPEASAAKSKPKKSPQPPTPSTAAPAAAQPPTAEKPPKETAGAPAARAPKVEDSPRTEKPPKAAVAAQDEKPPKEKEG